MIEMLDSLFSEIVLALILGIGGTLLAFFRKLSNTQSDLCKKVEQLQRAMIILATALDRQTNRIHDQADSDLEDLVSKLIKD